MGYFLFQYLGTLVVTEVDTAQNVLKFVLS